MMKRSLNTAYTLMPEEEQDPYRFVNDSTASDPNLPQEEPRTETPMRTEETVGRPPTPQETAQPEPEPVKADEPRALEPDPVRLEPRKTFAQMQADGEARPPMPQSVEPIKQLMGAGEIADETGFVGSNEDVPPPIIDRRRSLPTITDPAVSQVTPTVQAPVNVPDAPPRSSDALLSLLTSRGVEGDRTALESATDAKLLERLNSSSPYDSQAVRDEYDWLAGGIDDQFAMDERALDEGMARRGLFGSAGKDFHSGRLSDLNVGRRSAKISLAQDLANKYATSKGAYDSEAINQAQAGNAQADATRRAWLSQLMGYGNDAFANDLATAEFNQRQNESEQDFLMRMLAMGYGV